MLARIWGTIMWWVWGEDSGMAAQVDPCMDREDVAETPPEASHPRRISLEPSRKAVK